MVLCKLIDEISGAIFYSNKKLFSLPENEKKIYIYWFLDRKKLSNIFRTVRTDSTPFPNRAKNAGLVTLET